jgi:hypothetical protein
MEGIHADERCRIDLYTPPLDADVFFGGVKGCAWIVAAVKCLLRPCMDDVKQAFEGMAPTSVRAG